MDLHRLLPQAALLLALLDPAAAAAAATTTTATPSPPSRSCAGGANGASAVGAEPYATLFHFSNATRCCEVCAANYTGCGAYFAKVRGRLTTSP